MESKAQRLDDALRPPSPARKGRTLTAAHLEKRFGGVTAVEDFSFAVSAGELAAIIGPNGAGKTTLLQILSGLIAPDSGRVLLDSVVLTGRSPEQLAALGVARSFQTSRVFPALSIWDSVRMGGMPMLLGGGRFGRRLDPLAELLQALFGRGSMSRRQKDLDQRAREVLDLFGDRLAPRRDKAAQTLSYANRRRLEIARAILADPDVLLLDEPTAGMNPTETGELIMLIESLHAMRPWMSIILVEHKMQVVRRLGQRVIVMDHGALLLEGRPETVLTDERVIEAYLGRRTRAEEGGG